MSGGGVLIPEPVAALPPSGRNPRLPAGKGAAYREGLRRAKAEGWEAWIRTYQDRLAVADGCWFDAELASLAQSFIESFCKHYKDPWRGYPFHLLPWQRDNVVWPLFGWRRPNGTRRHRRLFLFVPKKNGKTTLGAALLLCLLIQDQEGGAEIYTAATKRPQARIAFKDVAMMIRHSPALQELVTVHDHKSLVRYEGLDASLEALASDSEGVEGVNIHGLLCDELHAWTDRSFWDALYYGGAARTQPMILVTTTAGDDTNSLGYEEYDRACKIRDGVMADWSYLPVVYGATKKQDWLDPETWKAANPSWGVTIHEDEFRAVADEAAITPGKQAQFKRYRLNMWAERLHGWVPLEAWDRCAVEGLRLDRWG